MDKAASVTLYASVQKQKSQKIGFAFFKSCYTGTGQ